MKTAADIVKNRLCLGCGACAYICPQEKISLVDFVDQGVRPVVNANHCGSCVQCLEVCPAVENDHSAINQADGVNAELSQFCGPVLEVWEGHAGDPMVQAAGSSGGIITALSAFCLERDGMHGVLHIGQDPADPLRNVTTMSVSRSELMRKTGSRYAPASACDRLDLIEGAPGPCVFIGQPSEVTALRKACKLKPQLERNVGLTISFFCAGSPARKGTLELLRSMGIAPGHVQELRYRGNGWPGNFAVTLKGESSPSHFRTYKDSWGFVQAYRPFSVHLCPDGTGEDADISCGDPWYRPIQPGEAGSSLLLVRTERGRQLVRRAIAAGYVNLSPADPEKVLRSQEGLFEKRGAIWGRLAVLRLFGLAAPKLRGFSLFKNWWRLSLEDKLRSTVGTARRIIKRRYWRPLRLNREEDTFVDVEKNGESLGNASSDAPRPNAGAESAIGKVSLGDSVSVMVAIANYGTRQDHHLQKILAEYRKFRSPVRIVVLSDRPKTVDGAEVVVGLPSRDPYSLPFAHKQVMAESATRHDLFIYTEDDVLITEQNVDAFLSAQTCLAPAEIPGFIRSETAPSGEKVITSINHHFRWLPDSVVERGGDLYAQLTNQHSGSFIVGQQQLDAALASGGFLVPPHSERYGMLETAASDLYTQCGLRRLINLSRIEDFILPHLANKYYDKMGISLDALHAQIQVLHSIHHGTSWSGSLFNPQTRLPAFRWSKHLYRKIDEALLSEIPASARNVLSVGCGSGADEEELSNRGLKVTAIPVDAVIGTLVRRRGMTTLNEPLETACAKLTGQRFDAILLPEVLHLVDAPVIWLRALSELLADNGRLIATVANTADAVSTFRDFSKRWSRRVMAGKPGSGVQLVTPKVLRSWIEASQLRCLGLHSILEDSRLVIRRLRLKPLEPVVAARFLVTATPASSRK